MMGIIVSGKVVPFFYIKTGLIIFAGVGTILDIAPLHYKHQGEI